MATVQKIPLGRKPGQAKIVLPDQVQISLGELAGKVKLGLLAFSVGVGLEVFRTLLDEDVTTIVGERDKWNPDRSAHRHGAEPSSVVLGGPRFFFDRGSYYESFAEAGGNQLEPHIPRQCGASGRLEECNRCLLDPPAAGTWPVSFELDDVVRFPWTSECVSDSSQSVALKDLR